MTVLKYKGVTVVLVSSVFLRITFAAATQCELEKIFRTPKDMSNVNFDHFEIVERNGFDRSDDSDTTTTNTEAPPVNKSQKSGRNVANAQVLVRFGGDDVHGSNHIMKIPPQCRHVFGKQADGSTGYYHHPPPYAYPPPCPPHYYHPYPPPVPFAFPNYYFCQYGDEIRYLPPQLRQYFQRHRLNDFNSEEYVDHVIRNRLIRRPPPGNRFVHEDILDEKNRPSITFENTASFTSQPEIVLTRPRILKPLNLSNEDIEEEIAQKNEVKRDCSCAESKLEVIENKVDEEIVKETKKKHRKKSKKSKSKDKTSKEEEESVENDLEKLLDEALVLYKCRNCSSPPKLLVSYPITHRDNNQISNGLKPVLSSSSCEECGEPLSTRKFSKDIDSLGFLDTDNIKDECKCINCQCHLRRNNPLLGGKKFANDIDDLITIVYPNQLYDARNAAPLLPIPQIAKIRLDEADARQKAINFPASKPNYLLTGHSAFSDKVSSSFYSQNGNSPAHISHEDYAVSSGTGYKSDPHSFVIYQEPTEIKATSINIPYSNNVPEPTTIIVDAPTERYLPTRSQVAPATLDDGYLGYPSTPLPFPRCYYDSIRKEIERQHSLLPKYLKVIPRNDLQIVPSRESGIYRGSDEKSKIREHAAYCKKCGHPCGDGRYCIHCGVIIYAVPNDGSALERYDDHNLLPSIPYADPRWSPSSVNYPHSHLGSYCWRCPRETRQLNEW